MSVHFTVIGKRLLERFNVLFDQLVTDGDLTQRQRPDIRLRKRILGRGRSEDEFQLSTGITIQPVIADPEGGTSDREDVAYRFLVGLGGGTYTPELEDDWPVATWEQAIRQRYQQSRIGVTGLTSGCELACTVRAGKLPDGVRLQSDVDSTILELAVWIRESRRDDQ